VSSSAPSLKVALVSTGLGRVLRGFESFTESLFDSLRKYAPHVDVTLFQGGGRWGDRRVVIPNCHRYGAPARWFGYEKGNLLEKRSFALALYPLLRWGHYDIVHYNELVMGSALFHLRRYLGGRYKLLYCNGAPSPPVHYRDRCDFGQMLTGPEYEEAAASGMPQNRLFLLPYGADGDRFSPQNQLVRRAVRQELGIPEDARVVLTVAALNSRHKRVDYLIREIARLDQPAWLVAAGQPTEETEFLKQEGTRLLPGRFRLITWPYERMHLLYAGADAFSLCSLTEGFGLVTVEAMLSGLPVLAHDAKVFRWIAGHSGVKCINMSEQGTLAAALAGILANRNYSNSRAEALRRFSWERLVPQYVQMYETIGNGNRRT